MFSTTTRNNKTDAADFQSFMQDASTKSEMEDPYMDNLPVASDKMQEKPSKSSEVKETDNKVDTEQVNKNSDSLSTDHKDVKDVAGATKELKDKIIDEAAKELGVSEEDIENVLSQLGIGAADLLNTENVSLLVANVVGDGDVLSILTDENAAQMVLELNGNLEELVANQAEAEGIPADILKQVAIESEVAVMPEPTAEIKADANIELTTETSDVNVAVTEINVSESPKNETESKSDDNVGHRREDDNSESIAAGVTNTTNAVNPDNPTVDFIQEANSVTESSQIDTIDIINQIQDHIRTEYKEDMTQLQMQLNPENLGTVNLTIAAKEGNVSAQLMAQNEAVQAALESQIAILRESLEQQGVKVEAIEVTVASHEFEQNLEQGNDFNNQQEEENERLRKATRRININGLMTDEDIEELDEAEQVTAKMMQADGNSMDYRV